MTAEALKTHYVLAALLTFAILTLWVGGRWALSGVEVGAYVTVCGIVLVRRGRVPVGAVLLAPALMCSWAAIQWTAHWSAAPSATADAWLYWLAAACFVIIGGLVDRDAFLKLALSIGAVVCVAGAIQLFTSPGDVFWLFPSGFDTRVIGPFVSPNNYAAFAELLIPVALAYRSWQYLVIAAALAASVVASGSRTGATLVLAEIVTVLVLQRWNRRWVFVFAALTAAFSLIAGQQFLAARFAQKYDPFAVRREFLQSSLAMFRAQPLHGFGLGTWPFAYPQFAVIDTGETANHAHNEWAQWAAEGGLPALTLMLGLLFWTLRPAIRSVWGIGILAVFAHALVDYPFLRLGMAAWIFAFIGALPSSKRGRRSLPVAVFVPVLLFGSWQAAKLAYADVLYRRATPSAVERAAALAPDRADYQFVLAQLDTAHATAHLERALAANAYDTPARIGLALEREAAGDRGGAEQQLLEAARHDHQFAPAWALANYYFRNGDPEQFWMWVRKSTAISYGNRRALFDLCFLESGNAHEVFEKVVAPRRDLDLPFLQYLTRSHRVRDAAEVAGRIAQDRAPASRDALLDYMDAAIAAGETAAAWHVQNQFAGPAPLLMNGDFTGPLLNRGFGWKIAPVDGISVARTRDGGPALSIQLSGGQPESCELLQHVVALEPGGAYVIHFDYRTMGLPAHTGISWRLGAAPAVELSSSAPWRTQESYIRAIGAANLSLAYRRSSGSTRAEGQLFLRNARIEPAPL